MNSRFSRRALLRTLGASAGMLPLLNVEAAPAVGPNGFPRRLIIITWTNGVVPNEFYPAAGALSAALPKILSPLEPWKSKILALRTSNAAKSPIDLKVMIDANQTYNGHNAYPALLTGTWATSGATAPSIDQLIANSLTQQGVTAPLLNLGCRPYSSSTSWRAAGQKNTAETDPYRLFNKLFPGGKPPISVGGAGAGAGSGGATGSSGPSEAEQLRLRRQSVLDFALGELNAYSSRVGSDDRIKIQTHLQSLRDLEIELKSSAPSVPNASAGAAGAMASGGAASGAPLGQGCVAPSLPTAKPNFNNVSAYPNHVELMLKMVGAAVKCDVARCITLDLIDDGGGNSLTFPWLDINSPDYHLVAHAGSASYTQKTAIDQWFVQQIAALVKDLDATPEGSGSVLDNTTIVLTNDMNEGSNHYVGNVPFLLIGGCGGFFKTGRTVTFTKQIPHNQLLTSLCHGMGLAVPSVGSNYAGDIDSALTS